MFDNHDQNGVQFFFPNGWRLSVQWKTGNYCDNYSHYEKPIPKRSKTAETAIINENGDFYPVNGEDVQAYQTVEQVLRTMNIAASLQKTGE